MGTCDATGGGKNHEGSSWGAATVDPTCQRAEACRPWRRQRRPWGGCPASHIQRPGTQQQRSSRRTEENERSEPFITVSQDSPGNRASRIYIDLQEEIYYRDWLM